MTDSTKPSLLIDRVRSGRRGSDRTSRASTTLAEPSMALLAALGGALADPGRVRSRAIDRLSMGHDASHFALTPNAVVTPVDAAEVGRLFAASAAHGVPLTFRSGRHGRDPGRYPTLLP